MRKNTITKEWLESQNISVEGQKIFHERKIKNPGKYELKQHLIFGKPKKYGRPVNYKVVSWYDSDEHKQRSCLVSRLIYAWNTGICSDSIDIDHKDNDSLNNEFTNLQPLSHKDNMDKRPGNGHNDSIYYGMYGLSDEEVDALKDKITEVKNITAEARASNKEKREIVNGIKEEIRLLKNEYRRRVSKLQYNKYYTNTKEFKSLRHTYLIRLENYKELIAEFKWEKDENIKMYKDAREELDNYLTQIKEHAKHIQDDYYDECERVANNG